MKSSNFVHSVLQSYHKTCNVNLTMLCYKILIKELFDVLE